MGTLDMLTRSEQAAGQLPRGDVYGACKAATADPTARSAPDGLLSKFEVEGEQEEVKLATNEKALRNGWSDHVWRFETSGEAGINVDRRCSPPGTHRVARYLRAFGPPPKLAMGPA